VIRRIKSQLLDNISTFIAIIAMIISFSLPSIRKWVGIDDDVNYLSKQISLVDRRITKLEEKRSKDVCRLSYINKSLITLINENTKDTVFLFRTLKADNFTVNNFQIKSNESISEISTINSKNSTNTDCDFN
jgi:hypothetical protein